LIDRYAREEMSAVWSAENRYNKWLDIEILVCEAMAQRGEIPFSALENIKAKAGFDVGRIDEIEKTTKHDVIAFLTDVFPAPGTYFIRYSRYLAGAPLARGSGHPAG
jgi:adenylosuccinate lyase